MFDSQERLGDTVYLKVTGIALAIFTAFVVGYAVGADIALNEIPALLDPVQREARTRGDRQAPEEFEVFWEAWNLVESSYFYDVPDDTSRTQGAIRGMLEALDDPYTNYTSPEAADLTREEEQGAFDGIGAYVEVADEGGLRITNPFESGPAEEAGLLAGDLIVAVDGVSVVAMTFDEIIVLVRGPATTQVILTVVRDGVEEPFDVTVTRRRVDIPTVTSVMLEEDVGYVALYEFNQKASRRLGDALDDLLDQGAQRLILDLRNNPGGFLDQAVEVADLFLAEGDILIQRDADGTVREHHSGDGDSAEELPLVVLVNGGSASASEIVAGAIQDLDRGILIGEQTFGKGSVQLQYDLSDGSILRLTHAAWFTPNDIAIDGEGIEPDIAVIWESTDDGLSDSQVDAALEYFQEHPEVVEKVANEQ